MNKHCHYEADNTDMTVIAKKKLAAGKLRTQIELASVGYGSMASAFCKNLMDSGSCIVVGARDRMSASSMKAIKDGLLVLSLKEAALRSNYILLAIPDNSIPGFFKQLDPKTFAGKCIILCHGYSYLYSGRSFPGNCDVVLISPNAIANKFRENYQNGAKNFALVSVLNDFTGTAARKLENVCSLLSIPGGQAVATTASEEVWADLFAEQSLLVGGILALITAAFDTMTNRGISEKAAYLSTLHEIKYIVDTLCENGMKEFLSKISPTALDGSIMAVWQSGFDREIRRRFGVMFADIKSGAFHEKLSGLKNNKTERDKIKTIVNGLKNSGICKLYEKFKNGK